MRAGRIFAVALVTGATLGLAAPAALADPTPGHETSRPTHRPTHDPTKKPTHRPTHRPTERPTERPTHRPTERPTSHPTMPSKGTEGGLGGSIDQTTSLQIAGGSALLALAGTGTVVTLRRRRASR
ncbi:PT domain-containing protein [Streptomyces sp. NPDC051776]|uniref:PT domain-containing protein n=1 Tax=Streptomyces sp. NPDC051776 TaxID=3155414 RepID=UPI0034473D87